MEVILQNLTKKFPGRDRKRREDVIAVNDFTFEIPDGELIGLLGPSGCGCGHGGQSACGRRDSACVFWPAQQQPS